MSILPEGVGNKVLAVGMIVGVIGALNLTIVTPLFAFYNAKGQQLQDRLDMVRRYRTAADDLPRLRAETKQTDSGSLLLAGSSDALAAASLQSTLKDLVQQGGANLTSAQTLAREEENNFRGVGVRVAFSADLALLMAVLLGIETARPVLTVANLELHTTGATDNGESGEALSVVMDVYGFRSE